ncbi:hypothetical protein TYRP_022688 [Tyrophagus putrescentiae]|nr:hypothetical protein TYRP_022688 [Tyrophagus putrescentiae]
MYSLMVVFSSMYSSRGLSFRSEIIVLFATISSRDCSKKSSGGENLTTTAVASVGNREQVKLFVFQFKAADLAFHVVPFPVEVKSTNGPLNFQLGDGHFTSECEWLTNLHSADISRTNNLNSFYCIITTGGDQQQQCDQ